MNISNT